MDWKTKMRKAGCNEWHTIIKVKNPCLGYDSLYETDIVGIITSFLGDEDISFGKF